MMHVIPFPHRSRPEGAPLLCFLDLQLEYVAEGRALALEQHAPWMENCRRLLAFARAERMSIAHFRQLWRGTLLNRATPFAGWIDEFRPRPSEMVFERSMPSCYSADGFVSILDNIDAPCLVLAGLTGHGACLATVLDGFHRKHQVTFIHDASSTPGLGKFSAAESHSYLAELMTCYAEVVSTDHIIERLSGPGLKADAISGGSR
jgi:nicotinamidase-related amidase